MTGLRGEGGREERREVRLLLGLPPSKAQEKEEEDGGKCSWPKKKRLLISFLCWGGIWVEVGGGRTQMNEEEGRRLRIRSLDLSFFFFLLLS